MNRLKDALIQSKPGRIDETMVQELVNDLWQAQGYYAEGDSIKASGYFQLILDGIRTLFGVSEGSEADQCLTLLDEYKFRLVQGQDVPYVIDAEYLVHQDGSGVDIKCFYGNRQSNDIASPHSPVYPGVL